MRIWGTCALCRVAFADGASFKTHTPCGPFADQDVVVPTRRTYAQWDDATAVEVHINAETGDVRYPGQHNRPLKQGYARHYLRSLREVERFEQSHNVRSEMAWFDRGTGRGFDDHQHGKKITH
jgi:hypothetical protein